MPLAEQLDGAKLVKYDPISGLTLAWHGGTGIHGYTASGKEVAYWQVDCTETHAPIGQIEESMKEHIDEQYFPG
jgi:hypothetical protein